MENGMMLKDIGNVLHKSSKACAYCFTIGIVGLFITITFCGEYAIGYLTFSGHYYIVNLIVLVLYLLLSVGLLWVPCYFGGLILIGLGQIAINTAPEEDRKAYFAAKAGVPCSTTPPSQPARTAKAYVSPMLSKIIQNAINLDNDAAILHYLQEGIKRLTKDKEKQLIEHILNVPAHELRPTLLKIYDEITEPASSQADPKEPAE